MSFVLNYIPNVGSVIAMVLPTPVVLLDSGLEPWQKVMAFVGPGAVQGYVGNVLEPTVFGASLNMTPLSILGCTSHVGVPSGASPVRSSPCRCSASRRSSCGYINHPFANYMPDAHPGGPDPRRDQGTRGIRKCDQPHSPW